jgi:hypothetical protein
MVPGLSIGRVYAFSALPVRLSNRKALSASFLTPEPLFLMLFFTQSSISFWQRNAWLHQLE